MSISDAIFNLSDHATDPDRPFTGQSHTCDGQRGQAEVRGIRFRDLSDCIAKAWIDAAGHTIEDQALRDELRKRADDGTLTQNDLYALQCGDIDPLALRNCISVRVEKLMGIYPNVPPLKCEE